MQGNEMGYRLRGDFVTCPNDCSAITGFATRSGVSVGAMKGAKEW
jgi:hypothetical protein